VKSIREIILSEVFLFGEEYFDRWLEYVKKVPMLSAAIKVLHKIEAAGHRAYIVGGAVRDIVMGEQIHDIDITSNCSIDELERIFGKIYNVGKGREFGVIIVREGGFDFEVAMMRKESYERIKGVRKILK
jgi:tRNA nucleotidyltransferase (CCA-adding enzyme)